jgi:hypothetical protein
MGGGINATDSGTAAGRFRRHFFQIKKIRPQIRAVPRDAPTAMPTMAPVPMPEEPEELDEPLVVDPAAVCVLATKT